MGPAKLLNSVHSAYGNLYFPQDRWDLAKRSYDVCLKITLENRPVHPLTVAALYKLGCVEWELNRYDH